jgi:hypothetical protein
MKWINTWQYVNTYMYIYVNICQDPFSMRKTFLMGWISGFDGGAREGYCKGCKSCSLVEVSRCFAGRYYLHFQASRACKGTLNRMAVCDFCLPTLRFLMRSHAFLQNAGKIVSQYTERTVLEACSKCVIGILVILRPSNPLTK